MDFRLLILLLWVPQAVWQVLLWLHWWQVKEYRFDRFKVLLKQKSGRKKLYITYSVLKIILLLISPTVTLPLIILIVGDSIALVHIVKRTLRKPVLTQRAKRIMMLTLCGVIIVITLGLLRIYRFEASMVFAEVFLILGPLVGILWTKPIVDKVLQAESNKAAEKLSKINPIVIGITGSYGKSTTKEFLSHILQGAFVTEKTNKNQNNDFGVARKILNDFDPKAEVFVAEMGAYTQGEIKSIARFTKPEIGMITGLEPQHLELFGSFEKILDAKFELMKALPEKGLALFNVSNKDCERLAKRAEKLPTKLQVLRYKSVSKFTASKKINAQSKIVKIEPEMITFDLKIGKTRKRLKAPVTGGHFIENLSGAILLARKLKVSWKHIQKQLTTLHVPGHTMHTYSLKNGSVIIDDTNNSTPQGFTAALNYLETYKNKTRIVIASGIIELGTYSHVIHQDIAKLASEMADVVVLTSFDYYEDFAKSLRVDDQLVVIEDPNKLINFVRSLEKENAVVLLEGRLSSVFTDYLEEQK